MGGDRLPVERGGTRALGSAGGDVVQPLQRPSHSECAAEVGQLIEQTPRRRGRNDAAQMRRTLPRRQPLNGAQIRAAGHAHVAVRPRLLRDPLDGVVPVLTLAEVEVELTVRVSPAANVLEDDRIAVAHEILELVAAELRGFLVGSSEEDRGEAALGRGQPDIRRQSNAVAHRNTDVELDAYLSFRRVSNTQNQQRRCPRQ